METELAERKYTPLSERSEKDLREFAKKLNLNLPPALGKEKLVQAIKIEQTKQQLVIEEEARLELKAEKMAAAGMKPGERRKPTFEEVAIAGGEFENVKYPESKRVLVRFLNRENPGVDIEFNKGGNYYFHVWESDKDGNALVNVLPECLVSKDAKFKRISLAQLGSPVFKDIEDKQTGMKVSTLVGRRPRFEFIVLGDAPKGASFGLYLEGSKV